VSIRTTENYEFDKIRTAGVTGNATKQPGRQSYMFNQRWNSTALPVFSPRAATGHDYGQLSRSRTPRRFCKIDQVHYENSLQQI